METEEATLRLLLTMPVIKKRTKKEKVDGSCTTSLSLPCQIIVHRCFMTLFIKFMKICLKFR